MCGALSDTIESGARTSSRLREWPSVSVVIPCRNEEHFIDQCLTDVAAQDYAGQIECIVADGDSTDRTRERLVLWSQRLPRLKLIRNEQRTVSAGLNRAIGAAAGEVIVRVDVHTRYARDYVSQCVIALRATGADNVGGPWRASGASWLQSAISAAFQSGFGSGGARSRRSNYEGAVDSVYLGCWRKQTLIDLGLFDPEFVRNQDDELNLRITRGGGTVWQTPRIQSWYEPRGSLTQLFRQYAQYGYWKVRVVQKHRLPGAWRHVIPALAVACGAILVLLAPFSSLASRVALAGISAYGALAVGAGVYSAVRNRSLSQAAVLPVIFAVLHVSYGVGFLKGLFDFLILRRSSTAMSRLSR
jgi:succinoglycan biosynthesis protein ExoA